MGVLRSGRCQDNEVAVTPGAEPLILVVGNEMLTFYYGKTDGWCPVRYYEDMKKDFPDGDIRLCEKGISHAFVLGFSQEVAAIVADWMNI